MLKKKENLLFACPIAECGKLFKTRFSLKRHFVVHTQMKQFCCPYCDKKFALEQYLREHIYTHTREEPFVCGVNGCTQKFRQAGKLSLHRRMHKEYSKKEYDYSLNGPKEHKKRGIDVVPALQTLNVVAINDAIDRLKGFTTEETLKPLSNLNTEQKSSNSTSDNTLPPTCPFLESSKRLVPESSQSRYSNGGSFSIGEESKGWPSSSNGIENSGELSLYQLLQSAPLNNPSNSDNMAFSNPSKKFKKDDELNDLQELYYNHLEEIQSKLAEIDSLRQLMQKVSDAKRRKQVQDTIKSPVAQNSKCPEPPFFIISRDQSKSNSNTETTFPSGNEYPPLCSIKQEPTEIDDEKLNLISENVSFFSVASNPFTKGIPEKPNFVGQLGSSSNCPEIKDSN